MKSKNSSHRSFFNFPANLSTVNHLSVTERRGHDNRGSTVSQGWCPWTSIGRCPERRPYRALRTYSPQALLILTPNRLIKKDMVDPTTGLPLKDKDMIILKRGSTGYIGAKCTGEMLIAKHKGAVLMSWAREMGENVWSIIKRAGFPWRRNYCHCFADYNTGGGLLHWITPYTKKGKSVV